MTRTKGQQQPSLRLIWDELFGIRVPQALRALGFKVTWVRNEEDGAPPGGSTDEVILEYAQRTSQIIVTSNHDMMLICHEAGQRFVWIDPYGKQLRSEEQVLICFKQIREWHDILTGDTTACVRALRTKCEAISSDEAARRAGQRFRALERKKKQRATPKPTPRSTTGALRLVDPHSVD